MPVYRRMAIIGCGLIGSSLAHAARTFAAAEEIVAADTNARVRARVIELGFADTVYGSAAEAARGSDLVVVATPVSAIARVAAEAAAAMPEGATLTDVGSVKETVVQAFAGLGRRDIHAIAGHPIAGTEQSGPDAGFATLFRNRWTILTPAAGADPEAVARLSEFWTALGAHVETMDAEHHDRVLAITSHLPHLIAFNIVGAAADMEADSRSEVMKYSAGGFRDFTRIAASDPIMWRDVFLNNREAVLEVLARFSNDLQSLAEAIRQGDGEHLQTTFAHARTLRRGIIEAGQETAGPNFGRDPAKGS
jgi:cyclohexadieny/prephenate dehydrogenase